MLLIKNFLPFSQILWHLVFISCFNVRVCIALKNNNIQCPHWGTGNLVVVLQETWWPPNGTEIQAGPYCEHNLREILWEQWNASPAEIMHRNQWFPKSYIVSFREGQGCNAVVTVTLLPGRGDAFLLIWLLLWLSRESGSLRHPLQSLQAASNCCFKKTNTV